MTISIIIPGEPCAQGRPRATVVAGHARIFDPPKSRSWKGAARVQMEAALNGRAPILEGPVFVTVRAFHACPTTDHRKRVPAPRRWRAKRPDLENVAKAVLDAATGVLWRDDAQIARLVIEQFTCGQNEAPRLEIEFEAMEIVA